MTPEEKRAASKQAEAIVNRALTVYDYVNLVKQAKVGDVWYTAEDAFYLPRFDAIRVVTAAGTITVPRSEWDSTLLLAS